MDGIDKIRHATWLELFYDLIFVIVISKITHVLVKVGDSDYFFQYFIKYVLMFLPVWWAWVGYTLYNNRFDIGDIVQKILTSLQLFAIIILSFFVDSDFDRHYFGFTISYVAIRYLLVGMYWRAYYIHSKLRKVSRYFMIGFLIGATISLSSILFSGVTKYIVLYAGIFIDFLVPIIGKQKIQSAPINSHHLPERLGLMTIILLGESIVSITNGVAIFSMEMEGLVTIVLGYTLLLSIFWLYFSFMEKEIHGIQLFHGQQLIYGHLPLYLSLGLIANVIYFSIPNHPILNDNFIILVITAMSLLVISLQLIRLNYVKHVKKWNTLILLSVKISLLLLMVFLDLSKMILIAGCIGILLITAFVHQKSRKQLPKV